jgi:hypothetical protein
VFRQLFVPVLSLRFGDRLNVILLSLPLGLMLQELVALGRLEQESVRSSPLEVVTIPIVIARDQRRSGSAVPLAVDDLIHMEHLHGDPPGEFRFPV